MFLLKKFPRITPVVRPRVPSSPTVRSTAVTRTSMSVKPRVLLRTVRRLFKPFLPMLIDLHVSRSTNFNGFGTTRIADRYGGVAGSRSTSSESGSGARTGHCESYV
jgi:hypothetical protein